MNITATINDLNVKANAVEPHLSGLIGAAGHSDMQKICLIRFLFENRLHSQSEVVLLLFTVCTCIYGAWGSVVVKALRGINSRCCHWIFQ